MKLNIRMYDTMLAKMIYRPYQVFTEYSRHKSGVGSSNLDFMLSTGIEDMEQEEIFAGDYVCGNSGIDLGIIKWVDNEAAFFIVDKEDKIVMTMNECELRITGNKYELRL